MSLLNRDQCDATGLTAEELEVYGDKLEDSLAEGYYQEIKRLHLSAQYPTTDDGWKQLLEKAWSEAVAKDPVCKEISAISAERRRLMEEAGMAAEQNTAPLQPGISQEEAPPGPGLAGLQPPPAYGSTHPGVRG